MRNTKTIDPSLKKKITENDEKLKVLYDIELKSKSKPKNRTPATRQKNARKAQKRNQYKDDTYAKINLKTYNNEDNLSDDEMDQRMSKTIEKREDQAKFVSRMKKRMKFKNDKEEKKNNTIFNNTFSNVYKNLKKIKRKRSKKMKLINL